MTTINYGRHYQILPPAPKENPRRDRRRKEQSRGFFQPRARHDTSVNSVHAFWRIGKRIFEFQLDNQERAEYGDQLFVRLSANLDIGMRCLPSRFFVSGIPNFVGADKIFSEPRME